MGRQGESATTSSPMGAREMQLQLINPEAHLWLIKDGIETLGLPNGAGPNNSGTLRSC